MLFKLQSCSSWPVAYFSTGDKGRNHDVNTTEQAVASKHASTSKEQEVASEHGATSKEQEVASEHAATSKEQEHATTSKEQEDVSSVRAAKAKMPEEGGRKDDENEHLDSIIDKVAMWAEIKVPFLGHDKADKVKAAEHIVYEDKVASGTPAEHISVSGSTNFGVQQDEEIVDTPYNFFLNWDYWKLGFGAAGMSSILKACQMLGFGLDTLSKGDLLEAIKARAVGSAVDDGKAAEDSEDEAIAEKDRENEVVAGDSGKAAGDSEDEEIKEKDRENEVVAGDSGKAAGDSEDEEIKEKDRENEVVAASIDVHRQQEGPYYRRSEDPKSPWFVTRPALILDINGVLLTSIDTKYAREMPPFWGQLKVMPVGDGVYAGFKIDAPQFLDWCFERFDVFVWTCCMRRKALKLLNTCFPIQFQHIKDVFSQENCIKETKFGRHAGKLVFYKKLSYFLDWKPVYTAINTILVDDSEYKALWNSPGTSCIVKKMEEQEPWEMKQYLTTTVSTWLSTWLEVEDRLSFAQSSPLSRGNDAESGVVKAWWNRTYSSQEA